MFGRGGEDGVHRVTGALPRGLREQRPQPLEAEGLLIRARPLS
jgi:hypothetical protein